MIGVVAFLADQLQHNQLLQAAIVAAPMTAATYAARSLPMRAWGSIKRALTIDVTFNSDSGDYQAIAAFVTEQLVAARFSRVFTYHAEEAWDHDAGERVTRHHGLQAGYGRHWGWYRGHLVTVDRSLDDSGKTEKFKERLRVTFVSRGRGVAAAFAEDVRAHVAKGGGEERVGLFLSSGSWWRPSGRLPLRALDTVFTANGEGERLLEHIRAFEGDRDAYRRRGTPWHTGALLTGEPGTGKTSLIHAIASETRRSIRYLSLGAVESDQQLIELIASGRDWDRTLLVIEDADASATAIGPRPVADDDEAPARQPVSLSTLLNALDGLITPDGLVVIATTNHPERLDPALRRPGRFDLSIELGKLDWAAFSGLARCFGFGGAPLAALRPVYRAETGARLCALLNAGGLAAVRDHFEAPAARGAA